MMTRQKARVYTGGDSNGAGIFSITLVAIAAAALTHSRPTFQGADAFVTRCASLSNAKRASGLFTATTGQEAQAGWVEDAFNGDKADGVVPPADAVSTVSGASIDEGQVRGPAQVLVYDTSLRGEFSLAP
jgi:hypothetical protein